MTKITTPDPSGHYFASDGEQWRIDINLGQLIEAMERIAETFTVYLVDWPLDNDYAVKGGMPSLPKGVVSPIAGVESTPKQLPRGDTAEESRVLVQFTPQATINDRIISLDPMGENQFEVTESEALELAEVDRIEDIEEDTEESDLLSLASTAPAWIADWPGPYYCEIVPTNT